MSDPIYVKVSVLAGVLKITPRQCQIHAREGLFPNPKRGEYEFLACITNYVEYQREIIKGRDSQSTKGKTQKARLLELQADAKEIEIYSQRKKLLPAELVKDVVLEVAAICANGLESIPGRMASRLSGVHKPAEIKEVLFAEIRSIRQSISESFKVLADSGGDFTPSVMDNKRTTAKVSRRVGGRKPTASGGKRRAGKNKT